MTFGMRRVAIACAALVAVLVSSFATAGEFEWNLETYPVPTKNALPSRIAIDRNCVIWVLEANANKLGKFDPGKKAFIEYEIPTSRSFPSDIIFMS